MGRGRETASVSLRKWSESGPMVIPRLMVSRGVYL